ncbi:MAG: sigma-70 family RNA polymerase sigma factor [Candidatus Kapabacteria bacterium]|nr:sigma-70 family RNA polymerase sigma factor [Candidatus Kapabacteria bacterium]MDW8011781.1 sigma-70 family RNA polymerase sigma factor [Bacteroidota bacterium]
MYSSKQQREFEREALPHWEALYSFAAYLCRDRELAKDLVQDTFTRAWENWKSFQPGTNCKAWLFKILRNLYINHYRRLRRTPELLSYDEHPDDEDSFPELPASPSVETEFYKTVLDEEVVEALYALPESFRTIVILCDLEEFSYEDVANMLGIPIGTVRSRLHRARIRLAALLFHYAQQRGWVSPESPSANHGD